MLSIAGVIFLACAHAPAVTEQVQVLPPRPPSCLGGRSDASTAVVRCRIYDDSTVARAGHMADRAAAVEALAAGKTHLAWMTAVVVRVHREQDQDACRETNSGRRALASIGRAMQSLPTTRTRCRRDGDEIDCESRGPSEPPPIPEPEYECTPGQITVLWSDTVYTYELLSDEEAAARANPLIPMSKRPFGAEAALQRYRADGSKAAPTQTAAATP